MHPTDKRFLVTIGLIVLVVVVVALLGANGDLGWTR
jgi:hypothetical protein